MAVGLLAAIDPFEQLKKGQDTSNRNTVSEFHNAAIRYYGFNNAFPGSMATAGSYTLDSLTSANNAVPLLESAGELKRSYAQLAGGSSVLSKIIVTTATAAGSESVSVCWQPSSKSFKKDQNTQYDSSGSTIGASCATSAVTCYWCVQ